MIAFGNILQLVICDVLSNPDLNNGQLLSKSKLNWVSSEALKSHYQILALVLFL